MIKIKPPIVLTGILWGALFFSHCCLFAREDHMGNDTIVHDSAFSAEDTLRKPRIFLNDSLVAAIKDTVIVVKDTTLTDGEIRLREKKVREHSPPRATILSAVVPGLGQAYNRKYWKIPIIYAAGTVLYLYFDHANEKFNYWKDLYETEIAKEDGDQYTIDTAILNRDTWSKRRGYAVIFIGVLYVANVVDAMVDAHFYKFNISDDLTVSLNPTVDSSPVYLSYGQLSYGFTLSLNF
ncbi:MAG: DUF5683 domain-containing protein [Bacteroidales bacterium]